MQKPKIKLLNFKLKFIEEFDLVSKGPRSSIDLEYKKALTFLELQEGYTEDELKLHMSQSIFQEL